MDALPVTEKTDVPFKSHVTASYRGETVGVMHACGHDSIVGITPPDQDPLQAPSNHSDFFYLDERGMPVAMHAMTQVVLDYLESQDAR
jgi:hypothetical protein